MPDVDLDSLTSRQIPDKFKEEDLFLEVDIKSRKKQYFKGKAHTLTSINDTGEFDILAYHANFITLIRQYIILNAKTKEEQKIEIDTGVLSVEENKVNVYLDL